MCGFRPVLGTDIATEIYPHYKDIYPYGVKKMTALDPELSEEAQAVKIRTIRAF